MSEMKGYIKLFRKTLRSTSWTSLTPNQGIVLITLLLLANYEEKNETIGHRIIRLGKGELITTISQLSQDCFGLPTSVIRTAIKRLEELAIIECKSLKKIATKIRLLNWEDYQSHYEEGCERKKTNGVTKRHTTSTLNTQANRNQKDRRSEYKNEALWQRDSQRNSQQHLPDQDRNTAHHKAYRNHNDKATDKGFHHENTELRPSQSQTISQSISQRESKIDKDFSNQKKAEFKYEKSPLEQLESQRQSQSLRRKKEERRIYKHKAAAAKQAPCQDRLIGGLSTIGSVIAAAAFSKNFDSNKLASAHREIDDADYSPDATQAETAAENAAENAVQNAAQNAEKDPTVQDAPEQGNGARPGNSQSPSKAIPPEWPTLAATSTATAATPAAAVSKKDTAEYLAAVPPEGSNIVGSVNTTRYPNANWTDPPPVQEAAERARANANVTRTDGNAQAQAFPSKAIPPERPTPAAATAAAFSKTTTPDPDTALKPIDVTPNPPTASNTTHHPPIPKTRQHRNASIISEHHNSSTSKRPHQNTTPDKSIETNSPSSPNKQPLTDPPSIAPISPTTAPITASFLASSCCF